MPIASQSRLNQRLEKIGSPEFGWIEEPSDTQKKGMNAVECSDFNKKARNQLREWMKEEGLEITTDQVGNIIGIWRPEGCKEGTAPLIMGSHIDTVPGGGRYDGRFGVLAGLEALHNLKTQAEKGEVTVDRPIIVAAWTGEEGSNFLPAMPGSAATANPQRTEEILDSCANVANGETLRAALTRIGEMGTAKPGFFFDGVNPSDAIYIEAHIEQGPKLERADKSLGIVSDIYGCSQSILTIKPKEEENANVPQAVVELVYGVNKRVENDKLERGTCGRILATKTETVDAPAFQIAFHGEGDHAGGREMTTRRDAAYAAASLVKRMGSEIITESLTIPNGFPNRVPSDAILTVRPPKGVEIAEWKERLGEELQKVGAARNGVTYDISEVQHFERMLGAVVSTDKRDIRQEGVQKSERALIKNMAEVKENCGVDIELEQKTQAKPVHSDDALVALLQKTAEEHEIVKEQGDGESKGKVDIMQSGPFHDGIELGKIEGLRFAMLYVPSINGISHDHTEFTPTKDLDIGVDVMSAAIRKITCEKALEQGDQKGWTDQGLRVVSTDRAIRQ